MVSYIPCAVLCSLSHVQLFATSWPVARQAPPSMGFSRQEHWSGSPCPPPGDLPLVCSICESAFLFYSLVCYIFWIPRASDLI